MASAAPQRSSSSGLPEVPTSLREVPAQLREVGGRSIGLPVRAGRHITSWILWQTSRVSLLDDHAQPPDTGP